MVKTILDYLTPTILYIFKKLTACIHSASTIMLNIKKGGRQLRPKPLRRIYMEFESKLKKCIKEDNERTYILILSILRQQWVASRFV